MLEEKLPATEAAVKLGPAVRALMNVPCGYDFHSLSLMLAAWLGYHRLGIRVFEDGRRAVQISEMVLNSKGKKLKPKDFLAKLSKATVRRQDRAQDARKAREIIEKVEAGGLTRDDAEAALSFLQTAKAGDQISDPALVGNVDIAIDKLDRGLKHQEEYDKDAERARSAIDRATQVEKLAAQLEAVQKLATPVTVAASMPSASELRQAVIERIAVLTREQCQKLERLNAITEYGRHEATLKEMGRVLDRNGLVDAHERVTEALATLTEEKTRLEARGREKHDIAIVRNLPVTGSLVTLRASRDKLEDLKEQHPATTVLEVILERMVEVLGAIEALEEYVGALEKRLDGVTSLQAAKAIDREILAERKAFQGSDEWATAEEAAARCQRLVDYFRELEAPLPQARTQAEALRARLETLPAELEGVLSEAQQALAARRLAELVEHCAAREAEAQTWLEAKKAQAESGDVKTLERELNTPPAFLAEALLPDVEDLRSKVRQARASKDQEAQVLKSIAAISTEGRLVDLRGALEGLGQYLPGTPEVLARIEEKRESLETAVARLECQAKQWPEQLAALTRAQEVQTLRDHIQKSSAAYSGTEFAEDVDGLVARCDAVRAALTLAEKRIQPVDRQSADDLLARHQSAIENQDLAPAHVQQLEGAVSKIEKFVHAKEQDALQWLEALERDLEAGKDPRGLRSRLQSVPKFLAEDQQSRLSAVSEGANRVLRQYREDEKIQERLRGLQDVYALAALREQREKVQDWLRSAGSEVLREALSQRDRKLGAEIKDRVEGLRDLKERVELVVTLDEAKALVADLRGELSTFRGAPEESKLALLRDRATKLEAYFKSLQAAGQQPPVSG
jgi:hypothetical protein